jgi:polysaccharide transporter, PST family
VTDSAPPTTQPGAEPESPDADPSSSRLPPGYGSLRQRTARGTLVNGAFTVGVYSLNLLKGFVVAAFLTASEFGIWGIVVVTLGTLTWLKQVGISDKYIQQDEPDQEAAFQKAFTLELLFTGTLVLIMCAAVPVIALAYGEGRIWAPALLAIAAIPAGVFQAPVWVYYRRMEFVRQRVLQAVEPVLGFVLTVALAVAGAGYWSLIVGWTVGAWAGAAVALYASPYRIRLRFARGTVPEYVSFSWPLLIAGAASLTIAQGTLLLGRWEIGLAGVGILTLAASISLYTNRVDEIVTQTLYPAICAVKDRVDLLFESFVKSNRLALMWGMPFGVGLALFSGDLVHFALGDQWEPGITLIAAYGVIAGVSHIGFNWDAFFRARGETRPIAVWGVACMVSFIAAAVPLVRAYELDGVAIAMGISALTGLTVRMLYLSKLFSPFQILKHAARSIVPTVPAVLVVLAARLVESGDRTLGLAVAEFTAYVTVTVLATVLFERALLREVLGYLGIGRGTRPQLAT